MNFFLGLLFGLFMATGVLSVVRLNGNQFNLTLRGRRFVFITSIVAGLIVYLIATNLYINCDIRTGAADGCEINWNL